MSISFHFFIYEREYELQTWNNYEIKFLYMLIIRGRLLFSFFSAVETAKSTAIFGQKQILDLISFGMKTSSYGLKVQTMTGFDRIRITRNRAQLGSGYIKL